MQNVEVPKLVDDRPCIFIECDQPALDALHGSDRSKQLRTRRDIHH
jgi:hypothetical protein